VLERRIREESEAHPVVSVVVCELCGGRLAVGKDRVFLVGSSGFEGERRVCGGCLSEVVGLMGWLVEGA
jgi:hypothetical protein